VWTLTASIASLLTVPLVVAGIVLASRRLPADDPRRSLAKPRDVAHLTLPTVAVGATRLRPSLAGRRPAEITAGDVGLALGRLGTGRTGRVLFSSWEDVVLAYMAPRSGKSTALAIPAVLSAPGAVIATSNKADVWSATAAIRADETGQRVWTFDPQHIAWAPQTWWWDPLADLTSVEEAERLASHFVLTVEDDRSKDIWGPAAQELLAALMLAARPAAGRCTTSTTGSTTRPTRCRSRRCGAPGTGASPRRWPAPKAARPRPAAASTSPPGRAKCLRNPEITAWITPPTVPDRDRPDGTAVRVEQFRPAALPTSRQTLYLLSKDGGGSAAPLVAALTDRVMRAATLAAERPAAARPADGRRAR
jgi:hypothetical protein